MTLTRRHLGLIVAAALPAMLAGCLQIETVISLQPDGSATITERMRFSQALLNLSSTESPDRAVAHLLEKPAILERAKRMGQSLSLVSHEVRDAPGGARESVAVFRIADINELRYASPFLAYLDYPANGMVACRMIPLYKSRNYACSAGQMAVSFHLLKPGKGEARPKEGESPPPPPAPADVQLIRELGPVFRDVMADFKLRLVFESYAPIAECGFAYRGFKEASRRVDLINFSSEDLDKFGAKFLGNEEIMLDLLRGKVGSANIVDHTSGYRDNPTVPIFLPWGSMFAYWHQGDEMSFKPSRQLFDRHFNGKMLDYSRWAASPPDKLVPARFEQIGWQGPENGPGPATRPDGARRN